LNSDDDDVGSDGEVTDTDPQTNNFIIGLYEKVDFNEKIFVNFSDDVVQIDCRLPE
jgi:hypothetical protein